MNSENILQNLQAKGIISIEQSNVISVPHREGITGTLDEGNPERRHTRTRGGKYEG